LKGLPHGQIADEKWAINFPPASLAIEPVWKKLPLAFGRSIIDAIENCHQRSLSQWVRLGLDRPRKTIQDRLWRWPLAFHQGFGSLNGKRKAERDRPKIGIVARPIGKMLAGLRHDRP
jgi:hypothetical protein